MRRAFCSSRVDLVSRWTENPALFTVGVKKRDGVPVICIRIRALHPNSPQRTEHSMGETVPLFSPSFNRDTQDHSEVELRGSKYWNQAMDSRAPSRHSREACPRPRSGSGNPSRSTNPEARSLKPSSRLLKSPAEILHLGRCAMERATQRGWSLRRFRERVLHVASRVLCHGRRLTLVVSSSAADDWCRLWRTLTRLYWVPV